MRLGDLDELKAEFDLIVSKSATGDWQSIPIKHIKQIIDNFPTAHHPNCDICEDKAKQYSMGFQDGYMTGKARPKGEWKLVSDINNDIDVVCPFCNERRIICYAHGYSIEEVKSQLQEVNNLPNYCENCGADMRRRANCA